MAITILIVLLVVAMVLFSLETVPVDLVALGMVVALVATGILTPAEALAGFGSEVLIVLAGLLVLTEGLRATGTVELLGRWVAKVAVQAPGAALPLLLLITAMLSAFMSNTTCTALLLPVGLVVARAAATTPSRVLMPLAFASILGGTLTVMGTSTNVIVRGLLPRYDEPALGMFELLPVALPIAVLGLAYLLLARRLLPDRPRPEGEEFSLREYLTEVVVPERSSLVGRSVEEAGLGHDWDLNLLAILRGSEAVVPEPHEKLAAGDVLVVTGRLEAIERLGLTGALRIRPGAEATRQALQAAPLQRVEAVVLPRSELAGRSLEEAGFRQRYAASVVAISRHAGVLIEKLAHIRLRVGDVLLVQGDPGTPQRLETAGLVVLGSRPARLLPPRQALWATGIFIATVGLAIWGPLGLAGAVLAGCLALFLSRCLTPSEAYGAVDWRLLVLVAGMLAYGEAMEKTNAAAMLAGSTMDLLGSLGPTAVLGGFYLLTVLLTQPMSNQAAALVVFPVALETAMQLGINPRAMAVTVALAASSSFLTPLEPSCLLVYGPGGYRFWDYPRLGVGLTLIAMLLTLLLVPWIWPL